MNMRRWQTWAASVRGSFHQQSGLPNQDAYLHRQYCWGDIVVVADGLGSRPHSATGAQAVCRAVVDAARYRQALPESSDSDFLRLIHTFWLMRIAPLDPDDCLTTCLFVLRREQQLLLGRMGDGMIAVLDKTGSRTFVIQEQKESFSDVTTVVGSCFDANTWELRSLNSFEYDAFLICTDGVSEDIRPENRIEFARRVCGGFRENDGITVKTTTVKQWLKRWPVPGLSDDRTVACLYAVNGHESNERIKNEK